MVPTEYPTIFPTKKLTVANIFEFPPNLQKIVMALLHLDQAISKVIANETQITIFEIENANIKLVKLGFIGKKGTNGNTVYFCLV